MLIYLQMIETEEDKDKFERLYLKYKGFMYQIAMHVLHNQDDAEDAVHQAFLYLIKNLGKIVQVDCPQTRSYIAIISEHIAIDQLRKRQRRAETILDEDLIADEGPLPDHNDIGEIFQRLKPQYRELLFLHYTHGYSASEIAKQLNLKHETVKKALQRAKQNLQKLMKEENNE